MFVPNLCVHRNSTTLLDYFRLRRIIIIAAVGFHSNAWSCRRNVWSERPPQIKRVSDNNYHCDVVENTAWDIFKQNPLHAFLSKGKLLCDRHVLGVDGESCRYEIIIGPNFKTVAYMTTVICSKTKKNDYTIGRLSFWGSRVCVK